MNFARVTLVTRALPIHGKARTSNAHRDIMGLTMRMLEALRSFMFSKYRWLGFIGLFLLAIFVVPHYAYADYGVDTANTIVSYFVATLTTILSLVLAMIGNIILAIIEILLVPVLQYNEFASSKIIGIGWSLVRDVMNMFVVAILIVIAMYTILNMKKAAWEQNLKNLFFAVVLMNFSRTICGVLIDISQVVMLTFVNALLDIAAGNFAQMLGINKFGAFDDIAVSTLLGGDGQGTGITAATGLFMSTLAQIPLYLVIFGVLLAMAIAFLYRIVVLWILTIMSPMAFFMGGIKDVMPGIASGEKQWWGKFNAALLMGPILAFFLWLALSVSSSGNLLQNEGFKLPVISSAPRFIVDSLGSAQLGATLIAIVLLVTGMGIAAEQAKSLGGLAASWVTEGWAKKLATVGSKAALRTGDAMLTGSARAAGYGLKGLGTLTLADHENSKFSGAVGRGLQGLGTGMTKLRSIEDNAITGGRKAAEGVGYGLARVGEAAGSSALLGAAGSVAAFSKKSNDAQRAAAKKRIESMTDEEKLARLRGIETDSVPNDLESEEIAGLLRADFIKNKGAQKKYEEQYSGDSKKNLLKSSINTLSTGNADNAWMDGADLDKQKHKFFHMLSNEEQEKFRNSDVFDPKNLSQDSIDALSDGTPEQKRMYQALLSTKNDKGESFADRLRDKKIQGLVQPQESLAKKSAKTSREAFEKTFAPRARSAAELESDMAAYMAAAIPLMANPNIAPSMSADRAFVPDASGAAHDGQVKAMHDAGMKWAQDPARSVEDIAAAITVGVIKPEQLSGADIGVGSTNGQLLTLALARSGEDKVSKMSPAISAAYESQVSVAAAAADSSTRDGRLEALSLASGGAQEALSKIPQAARDRVIAALNTTEIRSEARIGDVQKSLANMVAAQGNSSSVDNAFEKVFAGTKVSTPAVNFNSREREIGMVIKQNPGTARHLEGAIDTTNVDATKRANEASKLIMKSVTKDAVTKLASEIREASGAAKAQLEKSLSVILEAATNEYNATGRGQKDRDRANALVEHIETVNMTI